MKEKGEEYNSEDIDSTDEDDDTLNSEKKPDFIKRMEEVEKTKEYDDEPYKA
jgi:hypothetical protein